MTNTQKAVEIAIKNMESYRVMFDDGCWYDVVSNSECYDSALEMAKWKDHQFKELLYKWLNDDGKIDITKGSIDELLKEIDNEF